MRIGVLDSGIGGLTTLRAVRDMVGGESVYLADDIHCPYGEKSDSDLIRIATTCVDTLLTYSVDIVVIACNTITAIAKPYLVNKYPDTIFVGTEPAIAPAMRECTDKISLMCTTATSNSLRVHDLIDGQNRVSVYPMRGLATMVEQYIDDRDILTEYVYNTTKFLSDSEGVVLGCTHFVYLRDIISELYPRIKIYDGNKGVARRVQSLVGKSALGLSKWLYSSGKNATSLKKTYLNHTYTYF